MSSVCLLKEIPFVRAHSCDVGTIEQSQIKEKGPAESKTEPDKETAYRSLVFTFKFGFPIIVQRVEIQTCKDASRHQNSPSGVSNSLAANIKQGKGLNSQSRDRATPMTFSVHSVEGNLLGDLIDFENFLGLQLISKTTKITEGGQPTQNLVYSAKGVGEVIRVTFKQEAIKGAGDDAQLKEELQSAFLKEFSSISFLGITSAYNIKPTVAYELLNLSLFFRKENLHLSANEVDVCLSLALANEQKMAQAREALARCINFQDYCTNGIIEHLLRLKNHEFSFSSVQKILRQITRLRFRSALLEMLRSTYFKLDSEIEEKVRSIDKTVTLYAKSKKRDRVGEGGVLGVSSLASPVGDTQSNLLLGNSSSKKNWRALMVTLYPNLTLLLEEVLQCDIPKYFKVAALDLLVFMLKHHDFLSRATAITCFSIVVTNLLVIRERHSFDWKSVGAKSSSFGSILASVRTLSAENLKANKYLKDYTVELKGAEDPYVDCMPALVGNIMTFFTNFNNMLPSLAAGILHKAAHTLIQHEAVFCFELPPKVLMLLCKLMEKTIIICQADLKIPISFISNLIVCQTVINNPNYRMKVEKSFTEHDEVHLTAKEMLALYVQTLSQTESTEELTSSFGGLWETIKTKYIFLVGIPELKVLLVHMGTRLRELALELEGQVLTGEFSEFDSVPHRYPEGLQDLKFEKIEAKPDSPLLISSKDIIKTKIEYLKNFRDIFGEFEYYLELIDCISANLGEKLSCQKDHRPNHPENGLDAVSKKLVSHFAASGLQLNNSLDSGLWDSIKEVQNRVCEFLLIFLNDSVFIDYFQSTWVILCNLLVIVEDSREEKLNSALLLLLQASEVKHFSTRGITNLHLVKCLHYVLEYTSKNLIVKYDHSVNEILVRLFHRVVKQIKHTQNTDLVRLLRFLLTRYPEELNEEAAITFFSAYFDKNFDIDSEGASKLLEQFFDIVCRRSDRDSILANLLGMVLESSKGLSLAQKNYEQRQQILHRRTKMRNPAIKPKVLNGDLREECSRKIKVLGLIFDRLDSKVIIQLCKVKDSKETALAQNTLTEPEESEQSSLFTYLAACLEGADESFYLMVMRLLQNMLIRVKPSVQNVNKGCLTVCSFVFRLILLIADSNQLGAECQHELLSTSLMIFSAHLPPASFDQELELYSSLDFQLTQKNVLSTVNRNQEVICFETLRGYLKQSPGSKVSLNDVNYVNARLYEFMRLYMLIRGWVESPWSSIKSLFCNLVGFAIPCTIHTLDESILEPLKAELSGLLEHLLESKESESVINGLNIMGALCGFGSELSKSKVALTESLHFFKRNSLIIPISVWEKVFGFQESWDITIQIASILMLQLTLPNEYGKYIYRKRKQRVKMQAKESSKSNKGSGHPASSNISNKINSGAFTLAVDKELSVLSQTHESNTYLSTHGLLPSSGALPQYGEQVKPLGRYEEEKAGTNGLSTQHYIASNNHSITGLSGDQMYEDDMNGSGTENTWLDKVFQEDELRQLLNLFKMHFNKEENKWARLVLVDRSIEYAYERDDRTNSIGGTHKLVADEIEIQPLHHILPSDTNSSSKIESVIHDHYAVKDVLSAGQPDDQELTKSVEPIAHSDIRTLSPTEAKKEAGVTQEITPQETAKSQPTMADHPVKKIIKMKNKLLEGLSSLEREHGIKHRSVSEDVASEKVVVQDFAKQLNENVATKPSKTLVTSQSHKGLFSATIPGKPSQATADVPRPRASTPGAPRTQTTGAESTTASSATGSSLVGSQGLNGNIQGGSGIRKSSTRKEISRVLSSQLTKHPTEGSANNGGRVLVSPKNTSGLENGYIKSLLKPSNGTTSGTLVQRSGSNKRQGPEKAKEKQWLPHSVADYHFGEETKKAPSQLGHSMNSDRVTTADFIHLKKRVIARAEATITKPLFTETGLLSTFGQNFHPHLANLTGQKPNLLNMGSPGGVETLLGSGNSNMSSKTKLLTKPSGKSPSLLRAIKEHSVSGGAGMTRAGGGFPTVETHEGLEVYPDPPQHAR